MEDIYMVYFPETNKFLRSGRNYTVSTFNSSGVAQAQITRYKLKAVVVKVTGFDTNFFKRI